MSEAKKFALIVWEQTEEFRKIMEQAEQKRTELVRLWKGKYGGDAYVGSIEPNMSEDGEPIFWINEFGCFHTGRFDGERRKWPAKEALKNSLKYGDDGWCTITELEQLIKGEGPLLERAMLDCGFRPHRKIPGRWTRIDGKKEKHEMSERRMEQYRKIREQKWPVIEGEELQRLNKLWIMPNRSAGLNRTYSIQANKHGLIYVYLEVNPFSATRTEQLGWFGEMTRNRGHIAKQQEGFIIEARNVKLAENKGIHIKTTRPDGLYAECVWPSVTPQEEIHTLACDLVSRVKTIA